LVASGGVTPQVSPDGETLLFSSLGNIAVMNIREHASKFLVPDFDNSFGARWSPDGGEIMFVGRAAKEDQYDWWIMKPDGTERRNTGLLAKLKQSGFSEAYLDAWTPGDRIVFAGKRGDQITLWGFTLSPSRTEMVGDAVRVTDDDSGDDHAAYAAGHLVFDRTRVMLNLWSLPVDVNQAKVTGSLERLTSSTAQKGNASLSADGKKLLYSMEKEGVYRLLSKDLRNGTEKEVGPTSTFYSFLSPDGLQFAYGLGPPGGVDVFTRAVSGWRSWWSHSVCERCGMPRGLASDMHSLLVWTDSDSNSHVDLVDLESGKSRTILQDPSMRFYGPELSPDGNWASFIAKTGPHSFGSYIVRIPGDRPAMPSEWINVNPSSNDFQMAFWSTDGNLIYLLDTHGEGNLNWLDAQGLDAETKRPIGVLKNVYHFQEPRVPSMDPIWNHPAAAGRILLELGDMSTNIWIADAFQSGPAR
jgi:Tol biopolymer transport system component